METLISMAIFAGVGFALYFLSLKFPLPEYGSQKLTWKDAGFSVLVFAFVPLVEWAVAPIAISILQMMEPGSRMVSDFSGTLHPIFQVILFSLACDFLSYWSHRLMHTGFLWRFHAFHHAPKSLNWLSGTRGTPVHYALNLIPYTIAAQIFLHSQERYIFLAMLILNATIQNLTHTSLKLPFSKQLEWLFITPRVHFVHHHPNPKYTNSNYAFVYSFWDRVFGTYTPPESVDEKGLLGIDYDASTTTLLIGFPDRRSPSKYAVQPQRKSA